MYLCVCKEKTNKDDFLEVNIWRKQVNTLPCDALQRPEYIYIYWPTLGNRQWDENVNSDEEIPYLFIKKDW